MAETILQTLLKRYPALISCGDNIRKAYLLIRNCYEQGGKLLAAGNGGSAADADHIAGELMKGFIRKRPIPQHIQDALKNTDPQRGKELASLLQGALPAIALTGHTALATACANDISAQAVFAQQLYGYARKGDIFLAISTSGNSQNLIYAAVAAKALNLTVIGLTGSQPSALSEIADCTIRVPETETYKVQELHLPVYHALCLMLETYFFGEQP